MNFPSAVFLQEGTAGAKINLPGGDPPPALAPFAGTFSQ